VEILQREETMFDRQADRQTGRQTDRGFDSLPHLIRCPAAREEVAVIIATEGQIENVGVAVERLLGAVTMVNVLATTGQGLPL